MEGSDARGEGLPFEELIPNRRKTLGKSIRPEALVWGVAEQRRSPTKVDIVKSSMIEVPLNDFTSIISTGKERQIEVSMEGSTGIQSCPMDVTHRKFSV